MNRQRRGPRASAPAYPGRVRIIAGRWRGRYVEVLDDPDLRPTGSRIRETLFNWLAPAIGGARCLDLFAGSGVLGLEAASRGADEVVMVDQDVRKVRHIAAEAARLGAQTVRVEHAEAVGWIARDAGRYDIVFLDPPFRQGWVARCCAALARSGRLAESALVYVEIEADADMPEWPPGWRVHREKQAGHVRYLLIKTEEEAGLP
ncbi:MAG: Ribosomal RNA small subunit methyltransferase D [Gammaproteobacteria bacterium]|nr:Ribosomal RNA small subunit methyltransferase D [Gammaproteobacteria bacterium]